MNLDRSHLKWIVSVLLLGTLATAGYLGTPRKATGSSQYGLLFGVSGTGLMMFAGLLPFGKKLARWRMVRLKTLQKGHIWLGLLSLPLVLVVFHAAMSLYF